MYKTALLMSGLVALFLSACQTLGTPSITGDTPTTSTQPIVILIHGGAGSARAGGMPEEDEMAYKAALSDALNEGYQILEQGGSSLDAVQAAILLLEDNPLFNAGRGSVLSSDGTVSMDASIMNGADLDAGAIAGVKTIRHPILAARAVMQDSPHVMLSGQGAQVFADDIGLQVENPDWFITEPRREQLQRVKDRQNNLKISSKQASDYFGTVGAVALDRHGNLAAATSTGGMTNKKWDRIGDSPIIGAGTYADNNSCAVSATGWGEYFIRATVARDICARVQWTGADVQTAGDQEIFEIVELGGQGGVLVIDTAGNYAFSFSTAVMFRGARTEIGEEVAIFKEHGNKEHDN
ncbi:MAG: isoaspartyl peptidase/L-asparaginase [Robiginitomaculum sp.]|nr:isoaspartyl peptidase/L-asparaginase [Robiginitomaculum sp.]